MDEKKGLKEFKELVMDEFEKIAKKGEVSPAEWDNAMKAAKILKDLSTYEAMDREYGEDGYSQSGGYSYAYRMYPPYMRSYGDMSYRRDGDGDGRYNETGMSGRRGRDSMGRYTSREGGSYGRGRGYSRHDAKEKMMGELEEALAHARSEEEKRVIEDAMDRLEN